MSETCPYNFVGIRQDLTQLRSFPNDQLRFGDGNASISSQYCRPGKSSSDEVGLLLKSMQAPVRCQFGHEAFQNLKCSLT
jgi:hypothetical protein